MSEKKESTDTSSTKRRTVRSYASRVFKESSVGVVSSVAQATSTRRRIFKIFSLIFCLTGFLYQSGKYLSFVFQYPTAVDIDVQRPDTYNIPAYTFCDNNRINRKIFCEKFPNNCETPSEDFCKKYESYCGENRTLKPKKEYYRLHDELSVEETEKLSIKLDSFEELNSYRKVITGPYLRFKGQEQIYLCYSLNDRVNNSLPPLTSSPDKIIRAPVNKLKFRVKEDEVFLPGNRAGILFALHSPFKAVNPFETGIFMRPGTTYMIYISMDEEILEKFPYDTNCVNYTELWEKNGHSGPRSQEMCIHNCLADLSLQCYGCIVPLLLFPRQEKYCGTEIFYKGNRKCPKNAEDIADNCELICRDDCRQTKFHFTVQERFKGHYDKEGNIIQDSEDYINVEIYLDGDEVIVYKHNPKYMRLSSDASQIFHDTAGWKCLETSMKCLQSMVDGCGENFKPFITNDFLELLFSTLSHTNRFVRETGYYVLGSLVSCGFSCEGSSYNPFSAENFGHHISKQLGIGLSDNWSQVRLASSECARKFLLSFKSDEEREVFYEELLPHMCLNRYYIADGVRIYSQESWRRIVKDNGRMLVKKYISHFVKHYIAQTKADNHAVREAACACIAELASKVDREATKPYVSELLQTLLDCFNDDSWPVRDAACLASGNFVLCFPNESKGILNQLYPLFFMNLKDGIPSVRQGASGALANVVKAYGMEAFMSLKPQIIEGLKGVKDQPSESEKYGQLDKGPATFGVVKRLRDNDMELHTNQTMYSCGSLAPKMGRGGGCSDHKFRKPPEPWEFADGCVHLVAELSQINELSVQICELLPMLHETVSHRHYTHHVCILESLCKQLPNICKGIGKKLFKQHFELFIDDIFYSLTCENILTESAASECLKMLSDMLGKSIFRARIENYNPRYVAQLDAHVNMLP